LRKTSGTITGDVRLNGFEQDKISFRRCSGYVEQFDVQQPELTVRETVLFSARLRLSSESLHLKSEDPSLVDEEVVKHKFVDKVLQTLELTSLSQSVVGTDGEGGLSFEQRKRLSIAVELAASPSIIFLDEVCCVLRFAPLCHNFVPFLMRMFYRSQPLV
jgi:ABC-type multidrug transport system ATPase subunit